MHATEAFGKALQGLEPQWHGTHQAMHFGNLFATSNAKLSSCRIALAATSFVCTQACSCNAHAGLQLLQALRALWAPKHRVQHSVLFTCTAAVLLTTFLLHPTSLPLPQL